MGRNPWGRWGASIATVSALLALGAAPRESATGLWSLRAVARPSVPRAEAREWVRNPIDAFILQKLQANGLSPAPEADRRTLIRRLTFDLIGLPPTPEEVEAFARDDAPRAYERLVDRLLASPNYGERWGRHWLDLVRYAETHGYERDDPKPNAWKYRDWVIRAINDDLPYDRFLVAQLAGDEIPDASPQTRTATGMYRLGLIDDEPADRLMNGFDQLDDVIRTVGTSMLGLSIHCARCHDHKFDPIPQRDYYRLLAFFAPGKMFFRDSLESISIELADPAEVARFKAASAAIDKQVTAARSEIEDLRAPVRGVLEAERESALDNDTLAALQTPASRRDADQKRLVAAAEPSLKIKPEQIDARFDPDAKAKKAALDQRLKALDASRPAPLPISLGLTDVGPKAEPVKLLERGDAHRPGAVVAPGFLSAIEPGDATIEPTASGQTTGRRLALARWIARGDNPLTARVMVNRLWQHHFGQGIVGSSSDFGLMGDEPSHPELLDWLAAEFVARGWSLKAMHRLMVTSATYRQSGQWNDQAAALDVTDTWLWRMPPRRLEAEPIRDAALAVSGTLNLEVGGPSVRPPIDRAVLEGQSRPGSGWSVSDPRAAARRSVYVYVKRTLPLPELEVDDAPDNADPCPRRGVTTTAPQALTALNSAFWHDQAGHFADRLHREVGDDPAAQVERAFQLALARRPTEIERRDSLDFLDAIAERIKQRPKPEERANPGREALREFCLVLLNTNEFVTVD